MSARLTVAVYIGGKLIDIRIFEEWSVKHVFFEAVKTAAKYDGCETFFDYLQRKQNRKIVEINFEGEDERRSVLRDIETSLSDYQLVVDLTARCIYRSFGSLTEGELRELPSFFDRQDDMRLTTDSSFEGILREYKLPFDGMDLAAIRGWR